MARRRNFGKGIKAKVAIEAIKGVKTINEIASIYEVHPDRTHAERNAVPARRESGAIC